MFQTYALFPHLSVAKNIGFGLEMLGHPRREVAATTERMLALVRMEEFANRKTDQLSMDYGVTEKMAANDVMASVYGYGAIFRSRLQKPVVKYG